MRKNETINNNQEDSKHQIRFEPFNYKNTAYKNIQPETCFGKLRLDESRLLSSCIDTSCLKNVQK